MTKTIDVVAAVIEQQGKLLAVRRAAGKHLAGLWELPGGKRERNETAEQCLMRELHEELRIQAQCSGQLAVNEHDYGDKRVRLTALFASIVSGTIRLIDHDQLVWLSPDEYFSVNWAAADIPLIEALHAVRHDGTA